MTALDEAMVAIYRSQSAVRQSYAWRGREVCIGCSHAVHPAGACGALPFASREPQCQCPLESA